MKTTKTMMGLFFLMMLVAINVSAQTGTPLPRCKPVADQIYFVDSGQSVTEVHPGSNNGNGYQLNILGSGVDKFQLVKERYMTSVSLVSASSTQAKWQVYFEPNNGQIISSVRMRSECTGRLVQEYRLIESVRLLDQ